MEKTLGELSNIIIYQDDICIGARNETELDERVKQALSSLKDAGMTISAARSVFKATELSFLGYSISIAGVKPDKKLVEKVLNVKAPTCKKDLDHFIRLINYFGRYIHDFAAVAGPLNELRRKKCAIHLGNLTARRF